jgi:hypothetical protein
MAGITDMQIQLMNIIANALFQKPLDINKPIDWAALYKEAYAQAVLLQVYYTVEQLIPMEYSQKWQITSDQMLAQNLNVDFEHAQLNELMTSNGIPYVILKGIASSSYYPSPILRNLGDVDFIVHSEDVDRASRVLLDAGFQKGKVTEFHTAYHKKHENRNSMSEWEMHYSVNGVPYSDIGETIKEYLSDIYETAVDYDEGETNVKIPDAFHHGLILILHTANHMTTEGIGLRHLCDWLVFENSFSNKEFTAIFEEKLKTVGLWKFAQLITQCGVRYLGCPPKEWIGNLDEDITKSMINDILNSGNFGRRDSERMYEAKFVKNYVNNSGGRSEIRNVATYIYNRTKKTCIFVNKHPVLMPIGCLYTVLKYTLRIVSGKRHIDNAGIIENAKWRNGVYKQFNLFKPEV